MVNLSFYIVLSLLALNQFTSVSKGSGLNIYIFDIGVGLFVFVGIIYFLLVKRSLKIPKNSVMLLIFSVLSASSFLLVLQNYSSEELAVSFFYIIRLIFYVLSGIVIFNMIDKGLVTRNKITDAFIYSALFLSLAGFIQLIVLPDFTVLDPSLGWDPHKNRLASTFFDPNFLGAYFVLCLVLLMEKLYPDKVSGSTKSKKIVVEKRYYIIFSVLLSALFLTFSRSAWGMFAVVVLIYGIFRSRKLLYGAFFIAFLAYFAVPRIQTRISGITDPADSASLRLVSWGNTLEIVKDNFWFGVGFNTFRYVQRQYGFLEPGQENVHSGAGSDSSLLFVFATTGILGFSVYLIGFLLPAVEAFFTRRKDWLVIFTVVGALLLESQFINSLFYPQIMFVLFGIFSLFS